MSDSLVSPELGDTRALSPGKFRFLRYWSLNITLARSMGQSEFPGFSYGDDEWARINALLADANLRFDYTLVIPGRVRAGYVDTTAELGHWLEVCQLQREDIEFFNALVADSA